MINAFAFWATLSGLAALVSGFAVGAAHDPGVGATEATRRFWLRALGTSLAGFFIFGGVAAGLST